MLNTHEYPLKSGVYRRFSMFFGGLLGRALIALLVSLPGLAAVGCGGGDEGTQELPAQSSSAADSGSPSSAEPEVIPGARRPANVVSGPSLQRALESLGGRGVETSCGPYAVLTDLEDDSPFLRACSRIAKTLDSVYEERLGLPLLGEPRETLFLFSQRRDFQSFARADGRSVSGYSGYASAPRGFVVMIVDERRQAEGLRTLAHEMTHLAHRRGLASALAPWLSEGLADAVGDTATADGLMPLKGLDGVEPQAARLLAHLRSGGILDLERLVSASRAGFDASVRSVDYEASALLVRYLLLEESLNPRFRAYLQDVAAAKEPPAPATGDALIRALELPSWRELERRFEGWLESSVR
ncbi:MAG: hypothetical protein AAGD01_19280 [Acidobacteriota bacterium]